MMTLTAESLQPELEYSSKLDGIYIKWRPLEEIDRFFHYIIIRNQIQIPVSVADGVQVFYGQENEFYDYNVENGKRYYYALFYAVGHPVKSKPIDYYTNDSCKFHIDAYLECSTGKDMYSRLPVYYRRLDEDIDSDPMFNQPLLRIMSVIGYPFDKLKTIADKFYDNIDIDNCCEEVLPSLMSYLGVNYDWNLSPNENRQLTKIYIAAYQKKGLKSGLRLILMNLLQSDIDIDIPDYKVKRTSSKEEIKAKRTVYITAHNFQTDFKWIEEDYAKFLEVIKEFVPKKFNVKLMIENNYFEDFVKTNMGDYYLTYTDVGVFEEVIRKPEESVSDEIQSYDEDEFTKYISDGNLFSRFVVGRRQVDIYAKHPTDNYVGNSGHVFNYNDSYNNEIYDSDTHSDIIETKEETADVSITETYNDTQN